MPNSKVNKTIRRITVATDFSEPSKVAVRYAAVIARLFGAQLEIVHAIDLSLPPLLGEAPAMPVFDSMREIGKTGLEECCRMAVDVQCSSQLVEGTCIADEILVAARKFHADLLVIATTSKKGLAKFVFGSKAERIYRTSDLPVLVVGPGAPESPHDAFAGGQVVYASDLLQRKIRDLDFAVHVAKQLGATLHLCHVLELRKNSDPVPFIDEEVETSLQENLKQCGEDCCQTVATVEYGKAKEAILTLANRLKAGMIILGAREDSFWLTYFETGISTAVISEARCPVLVLATRSAVPTES